MATERIPLDDFIDYAATTPLIGLDTESNGEPIRDGRGFAQGVSLAFPGPTGSLLYHYLPFRHRNGFNLGPKHLAHLKDVLDYRTENGLPFASHNSPYDIPSLATIGIDVSNSYHICTLLKSHLIDEIMPFQKSLEECVKRYAPGLAGKKDDGIFEVFVKRFGWANIPSELMYEYGSWDAALHYYLALALDKKWKEENLEDYWRNRKRPSIPVWNAMMNRGVRVDTALCDKMAATGHLMMDEIKESLNFNPGSTKDLHTFLIDNMGLPVVKYTSGGKSKVKKPSFDKHAMEIYDRILERSDSHAGRSVLEYRGWQKSVSSNYEPYVRLLSPDGRLRPNYKLHGTKTLRASCEYPNLQQIPRVSGKPWNGLMKQCFVARPGYKLIEADFSQLEFRLSAAYGRETSLISIFADPTRDVFTEIAKELGFPRQEVKLMIYMTGYEAGPAKVALSLGLTESRATELINRYYTRYPGIRAMSKLAMNTAKADKKVKIWSGRYRHFNHPYELEKAYKAFNSVIQGGAADMVENRMQALYREIDSEDCRMLLQVHDSIVFEIREDLVAYYIPEIRRIMEAVEPDDTGVKFRVDIKEWSTA